MKGHWDWQLGKSNPGDHCLPAGTEIRHDFLVHEDLLQWSLRTSRKRHSLVRRQFIIFTASTMIGRIGYHVYNQLKVPAACLRERKFVMISWYTRIYFNGYYGRQGRDIAWSDGSLLYSLRVPWSEGLGTMSIINLKCQLDQNFPKFMFVHFSKVYVT